MGGALICAPVDSSRWSRRRRLHETSHALGFSRCDWRRRLVGVVGDRSDHDAASGARRGAVDRLRDAAHAVAQDVQGRDVDLRARFTTTTTTTTRPATTTTAAPTTTTAAPDDDHRSTDHHDHDHDDGASAVEWGIPDCGNHGCAGRYHADELGRDHRHRRRDDHRRQEHHRWCTGEREQRDHPTLEDHRRRRTVVGRRGDRLGPYRYQDHRHGDQSRNGRLPRHPGWRRLRRPTGEHSRLRARRRNPRLRDRHRQLHRPHRFPLPGWRDPPLRRGVAAGPSTGSPCATTR